MAWTPENHLVISFGQHNYDSILILDQSGIRPLIDDPAGNRQPTVCGNGKYIIYAANFVSVDPLTRRLMKMDKDGNNPQRLTIDECESKMFPHCTAKSGGARLERDDDLESSAGGRKTDSIDAETIFSAGYFAGRKNGRLLLSRQKQMGHRYYLDRKRQAVKQLPILSTNFVKELRWTPDGKNLAFAVTRGGVSNIWLEPLDGSAPTQLTHFEAGSILYFDWSPDGRTLAYASSIISSDIVSIADVK